MRPLLPRPTSIPRQTELPAATAPMQVASCRATELSAVETDPWGERPGWAGAWDDDWWVDEVLPGAPRAAVAKDARMRAWLVNIDTTGGPRSFALRPTTRIGRGRDCDIVLRDDPLVSRSHALVHFDNGELWVEDDTSQNGTFVNSQRTAGQPLRQGDILKVGRTRFAVQTSTTDAPTGPVPAVSGSLVYRPIPTGSHPAVGPDGVKALLRALDEDTPASSITSGETAVLRHRTRAFLISFELSQQLQRQRDPQAMIELCLDTLLGVLPAVQGQVIEVRADGGLEARGARCVGGITPHQPAVALSKQVHHQVITDRCGVLTNDPLGDFESSESLVLTSVTSLVAAPMIVGDRVLGLIELINLHPGQNFNDNDLELLTLAASMLATHLEARRAELQRIHTIEQLQRAQAQLRQTQQSLIREHQRATLGQFAKRMAHELRNNLLAPLAMMGPIADRYPEDSELVESVNYSLKALHTIVGIVKDIQEYSSTGSLPAPDLQPGDLGQVAEDARRYLRYDPDVSAVSLRVVRQDVPLVPLDAARLTQVIINLVRNAAQSTSGPVRRVSVHVFADGDDAVLEVRDNGCGMGLEVACQAYEAFYSTKEASGGMGVGLEISRELIDQHRGALSFRTWPGRGTTFQIRLHPADPDHSTEC